MANFKNVLGKGRWDPANNCLTITNGDSGELILWGDGPGGTPLVIALANGNLISGFHETAGPGTNERTFTFKAMGPGTVTVFARVGSITGVDYVMPLTVVIVPKKASSIGPEHVVLYAGQSTDEEDLAIESYQKAVGAGGTAYRLSSYTRLYDLLTYYRDSGRKISRLEVNTHGAPGYALLSDGSGLTKEGLSSFKGKGFDKAFAPGARVFFHGCNIADGTKGEEFLTEFGKTFLFGGGGTVAGSTSIGFGTGHLGGSHIYHLWGDVVRVYIATDGSVEKVERN